MTMVSETATDHTTPALAEAEAGRRTTITRCRS